MFGGKKDEQTVPAGSTAAFEYLTKSFVGDGAFNKGVNQLAAEGWEVINANLNGAAHHVYFRRAR